MVSGSRVLGDALARREKDYRDALNAVRDSGDPSVAAAVWPLREAIELVGCLRRLVAGRSLQELHAAFGAPGDLGYDTPIGDALAQLYRGEEPHAQAAGCDDGPSGPHFCACDACPGLPYRASEQPHPCNAFRRSEAP